MSLERVARASQAMPGIPTHRRPCSKNAIMHEGKAITTQGIYQALRLVQLEGRYVMWTLLLKRLVW